MTTLYDIGDVIEIHVEGKVKEISLSEREDSYMIVLYDFGHHIDRVFLDSNMLMNRSNLLRRADEVDTKSNINISMNTIEKAIEQLDWYFYEDDGGAAEKNTKDAYELLKRRVKHES